MKLLFTCQLVLFTQSWLFRCSSLQEIFPCLLANWFTLQIVSRVGYLLTALVYRVLFLVYLLTGLVYRKLVVSLLTALGLQEMFPC